MRTCSECGDVHEPDDDAVVLGMAVAIERRMALEERTFPDGRHGWVYPLTFGRGRLGIGRPEDVDMDDVWEYRTAGEAVRALTSWDGTGEPAGWMRHPASGRRRPGGDPQQEYVLP